VTSSGKLFQTLAPAIVKTRLPTLCTVQHNTRLLCTQTVITFNDDDDDDDECTLKKIDFSPCLEYSCD